MRGYSDNTKKRQDKEEQKGAGLSAHRGAGLRAQGGTDRYWRRKRRVGVKRKKAGATAVYARRAEDASSW